MEADSWFSHHCVLKSKHMTYLLTKGEDRRRGQGTLWEVTDVLWNTSPSLFLRPPTTSRSLSHLGSERRGLCLDLGPFTIGEVAMGFYLFLQSEVKIKTKTG